MMGKVTSAKVSRRNLLKGAVAAGGSLAVGFHAPAIMAQTRAPLRLGILNTFSGPVTYSGENNLAGMQLYIDRVGGKIAGRRVELIKEDDQFNPQIGLQKAKKFIESDKVDMILGPQASNVAMAMLNYVKQSGAYLVVTAAGNSAITAQHIPTVFRTSLSSYQLNSASAEWIYANVAKEIVITASDYAGGRDVIQEFTKVFIALGGKVLKEIYPPLGTTDFSAYLTDIRSLNPPATYNFYPGTDAVRFVQQYSDFGLKDTSRIAGYSLVDATTMKALGRAAIGVITSTVYTPELKNPENTRFVADYRAKYSATPDLYSDYGFVAAQVIDETLKATDGDTSNKEKLSEAMVKVAFNAPRGPFRFDPVSHNPVQNVYICKVIDAEGTLGNEILATIKDSRAPA